MHYHHFFLFSLPLLLTLALPSFAKPSVRLAISPSGSREKLFSVVPFDTLIKLTLDRGTYISVDAGSKDIVCQFFKDKEGTQTLGTRFTFRGIHIPDGGPTNTIYCSDADGLQGYLVKMASGPVTLPKGLPTPPNPARSRPGRSISSQLKPGSRDKPDTFVLRFHSLMLLEKGSEFGFITVAGIADVKGLNKAKVPVTLERKDVACQCYKDKSGTQPHGDLFSTDTIDRPHGCAYPNVAEPTMSIFCSDEGGLRLYTLSLSVDLGGPSSTPSDPIIPRRSISSQPVCEP
ncbi:MAG: hypothetical protein Q9197_004119 [Variospora fuerteventurae]